MGKTLFLLTLLCAQAIAALSQQTSKFEKWGKIPETDLTLTHCTFDSGAASMVLQEVGNYELTFIRNTPTVLCNFWTRIKIFNEFGLEKGNLRIYYRSDGDLEKFSALEVHVILPNGKIEKVNSDNIFTEEVNKYVSAKKIFIPNFQKGCIIEYRYEIQSANVHSLYKTWFFQKDIPVRWSQLTVTIPQYFNYVYLMQANRKFDLEENKQGLASSGDGYQYQASTTTFGLANLPAVKDEPFITTLEDYRAQIGFQLSKVSVPGEFPQNILTSWTELADGIIKGEGFGQQYLQTYKFDKLWKAFRKEVPESTPKLELPEKVLHFISTNIKWDGGNYIFSDEGLDAAFVKKTGSTADINLAVVALLRKLDFDVVPMLLSTREHGRMYNNYPFSAQFNKVVAFMYEGNGGVLLDATDPMLPLGQMRRECYNGQGWLVDEKRPNWVQISPPEYIETWFSNLKINADGELSGHFTQTLAGPAATRWRSDLEGKKEADFIKEHFANIYPDRILDSIVISDRETHDKPLKVDFYCRIPNAANPVNDFLYLRPILEFYLKENPLKSIKRNFPVNFTYPLKAQYVVNFEIPKGYVLEDLSQPSRITLPNNGGKIQFSCGKTSETEVQVVLKMSLAQLEFLPAEYDGLRQFFEFLADKVQFQLALKKT